MEQGLVQIEEYVCERKFSSYLTHKLQMLDLQRASRQFKGRFQIETQLK